MFKNRLWNETISYKSCMSHNLHSLSWDWLSGRQYNDDVLVTEAAYYTGLHNFLVDRFVSRLFNGAVSTKRLRVTQDSSSSAIKATCHTTLHKVSLHWYGSRLFNDAVSTTEAASHAGLHKLRETNYFKGRLFNETLPTKKEPGSSVSIVSGYGLDDRTIEVRSPVEAKGFFL
jgi:hypothetical protein